MNIKKELTLLRSQYDKPIELVEGLKFSQKNKIRTIEFYSNSEYLNGKKDELGREKPFYQILNGICDVENAAKDVDTKDVNITSDDSNHYLESFLISKDVQVWMKEADFDKTLNDMRDIHTRYGSLLVKKVIVKEGGKKILKLEMPEWKNIITDQVDIINNPIVEVHYMTAAQLSKKVEWSNTKDVIEKIRQEGATKRIPVYEVRGDFTRASFVEVDGRIPTAEEENEYSHQLYYIAGIPTEGTQKADMSDTLIPLYWEDDTERVYKYLARKPKDGRAFGVGVYEEGEEAQVWVNDTVLKQYRAMEYTTKVIGQSASKKLKGRNLLTETDDGTILEHEDGKPITSLNLLPSGGLQQYNNLIQQWSNQLEKTTSAYAAQRGDTPPSGTPFRLQATVLQQSSSVFKTLQQEFGIFLTEIFEDWIMPHLATKLNKEHILAYDFAPEELKEIDKRFSASWANKRAIEEIIKGGIVDQETYDNWIDNADQFIKITKNKRFIDIPENFYKDLKAKVTVNITGEQKNKAATLESLNNLLITYASNPNISQDPVASMLLMKIAELSGAGISPVQISGAINEKARQPQVAPEGQPQEQEQMSLEANATPQV